MDCQQAQNYLLSAESLMLLGPELAAHIAECPQCQALLAKLRRLEAETKALPVPAGHEQPSPEFLRTVATLVARSGPPVRHFVRRAIAAAVVLAFGLAAISLIFFNGSAVQADVLLGQLVDWNLAIAHTHDTAGRARVYQQQLQQLQKQVDQSHLVQADRALAAALLNNAQWMTTELNASDESQHFQSLASQLLARQQAASAAAAAHLQQIYQELIHEGVSNGAGTSTSPPATEQPNGTSQPAPSSALPGNQSFIPRALKTGPVAIASGQSNSIASSIAIRDFSGTISGNGASTIIYPPRGSMTYTGATHAIGEHSHRLESHPSDGGAVSTSGQTSRPTESLANVATTVQPAHGTTVSSAHPLSNTSLPTSSHPCMDDGSQASWNAAWSDGKFASMERLTGLEKSTGFQPPAHWQVAADYNMDDSVWLNHASNHDGSALMPSMDGIVPLSRHEIDALLARHIHDDWAEISDLMLPYPPPPMDEQSQIFFGLASDNDRPVQFPEPAIAFALPLIALAARRQRRITKPI